jgi:hypothetical protein
MTAKVFSGALELCNQTGADEFTLNSAINGAVRIPDALQEANGNIDPEGVEFEFKVVYGDITDDTSDSETFVGYHTLDASGPEYVHKIIRVRTIQSTNNNLAVVFDSGFSNLKIFGVASWKQYDKIYQNLVYNASQFRLDAVPANRAAQIIVGGQSVSRMGATGVIHFGDGYLPLKRASKADIHFTAQMDLALADRNIMLSVKTYNSVNTLIRTVILDNILVPDDKSEFTLVLADVLIETDLSTADEGRVEVARGTPSSAVHSGWLEVKKAEVKYV